MTAEQLAKIGKRMLWIIPGLILAIIGDYYMGLEPKDSAAVSFMISSGWLTIADGSLRCRISAASDFCWNGFFRCLSTAFRRALRASAGS